MVGLHNGNPRLIYVHVEVQGQYDAEFAERMFVYNYRLYDRYRQPVASLAVLADDQPGWRPDHFSLEALGCKHQLNFPIVKLLDYAEQVEQLESCKNPLALVTLAHLRTRQTQKLPQERFEAKLQLIRLLYQRSWERQQILDLLRSWIG